jgi:Zn-dependent protease
MAKSHWQLGKFGGVPLQFHWSFVLVFVWIVYSSWQPEQGIDLSSLFTLLIWVGVVFCSVLLHEYGHAFMARAVGVKTEKIVLFPLGGGAFMEKMPEEPSKEILIAVAGPLVNIFLAAIAAPFIWNQAQANRKAMLLHMIDPESNVSFFGVGPLDYFIVLLFLINLLLAFFNLLPAYPLDGGRIFRAALSWFLGRTRATLAAAIVGIGFAGLFLTYAIYMEDWIFGVGALMVGAIAAHELIGTIRKSNRSPLQLSDVVDQNFVRIYTLDSMALAWEMVDKIPANVVVLNNWQEVVGILNALSFREWQADGSPDKPVADYLKPQWWAADIQDSPAEVYHQMQLLQLQTVPVFQQNKFIGTVNIAGLEQQ